jgi:hypothetical protein
LPLVEPRRGNETSPFSKAFSKQRQLVHRLSPRVDVRDLGLLLHPERDQSPACHDNLALSVAGVDAYNRDLVSGSDIIAEGEIGIRQALSLEEAAIRVPRDEIVKSTTHASTDKQPNRKTKPMLMNADF